MKGMLIQSLRSGRLKNGILSLILIVTCVSQSPAFGNDFKLFRTFSASQQNDEALRILKSKLTLTQEPDTRALAHFGLGVLYFNMNNHQDSQLHMHEALKLGTRLDDYAYFYLAESYRKQGNVKDAKREYEKVITYKPTSQRFREAKFALAEIAIEEKNFRQAALHLAYLERKTRRTAEYTPVLYNLVRADLGMKSRSRVCRWMRTLYTRYPADNLVKTWGVDLHKVEVDGQKPQCLASPNDLKTRIRNLQHAGQSQRAREEIEVLRKRSGEFASFYTDQILANFLINDGHVDEAFKILVPHYNSKRGDYGYLMLMAKAAARAGEYQMASGAYYRAYQLAPGSRKGREALFQAAFLSYQNKDYDGASTKFQDFKKKFATSGLSRDAQWYLSWIDYLKQDYDGAYAKFSELLRVSGRKARMTYSRDRVDYWRAMSLMKAGKLDQAKLIFESLAKDNLHGYYAIVSRARLETTLKEQIHKRALASQQGNLKTEAPVPSVVDENALPVSETGEPEKTGVVASVEEEAESGIQLADDGSTVESDGSEAEPSPEAADVVLTPEEEPGEEPSVKTSFKDPRLMARFKRAGDLSTLGLNDWARYELWEIERRTRNREYLRMLMTEYEMNQAFHRSSAIAQEDFRAQRAREGLEKAQFLWQYSYPKAFERTVGNFARSFKVSQEFVWSIMRAESRYKADVVSPVGAIGLMQLMPYTADHVARLLDIQGFQTSQLVEPEINIRLGVRYLQRLQSQLNGSLPLVAAAYNAGPHRVAAWLKAFGSLEMDEFVEHIPFFETRNYVKKVVHNYYIYTQLYSKEAKGKTLAWLAEPPTAKLDGPVPTKELWD